MSTAQHNYAILDATLPDGSRGDLFVANGRFVPNWPDDVSVIDATGLIALPGFVDSHTHLREPGGEEAETIATGTLAAARGGYTAVMAMPNTVPTTNTATEVEWLKQRTAEVGSAEVLPIGAITWDRAGTRLADIAGMAEAGVRVFSDDGSCVMDAGLMRDALLAMREFDGVVAQHAQDHTLAGPDACCGAGDACATFGLVSWPREAEWRVVERDIELARDTHARLHVCHISTSESIELIRQAKADGIQVTCEVTPHHLLLTSDLLASCDTVYKVNPPLRPAADTLALRQALADGTIDMIGTDHAPHTQADKALAFPAAKPGMVGLEQALAVVIETMVTPGLIRWNDVVRVMSYAPAALPGNVTNQGRSLTPGEPANLVLVNPTRRSVCDRKASASKGRNCPYHALDLPDPIELTLWVGRVTNERA
ncbi:MAG: dihydroorotase [Propionibacteriaceae bacterium]|nr:dihydroorotase [Propionibacteriaceae bacterium]